ncbi:MAG: phage integrase SAM-like domain-containing protein [Oscillospiraceae bacterium]|nr:phage integrase SAM-like domain-containing protein [Oscillospiraceae bacterium]
MQEWFDLFGAIDVASTTEASRRSLLKNHIYKEFGALDVQDVTLERLQRFFNSKVKSGMSTDTMNKIKNLLRKFFVYAVKKGYIKLDPMPDVVIRKRAAGDLDENKGNALRPEIRPQVFMWLAENPILKPMPSMSRPPKRWTVCTQNSRKRKIRQALPQPAGLSELRP